MARKYRFFTLFGRQFGICRAPFRWFYWHNTPWPMKAGGLRIGIVEVVW